MLYRLGKQPNESETKNPRDVRVGHHATNVDSGLEESYHSIDSNTYTLNCRATVAATAFCQPKCVRQKSLDQHSINRCPEHFRQNPTRLFPYEIAVSQRLDSELRRLPEKR